MARFFLAQRSIREQVLDSAIELKKDYLLINDKFIRVFCLEAPGFKVGIDFYDKLKLLLTADHEYLV